MFWKNQGHDRPVYIINAGLTICSMCLSGYFGWVLGEGVVPLNYVLALLCMFVAFGVSTIFERTAVHRANGRNVQAVNCLIVGVCFAFANTLFDYSSAAALREAVAVSANNQNHMADTRKGEVQRLKERQAEIARQTAWKTTFEAPDAYRAEITNLEGNGTIMKRSKGCSDQTVPDTMLHCKKLAEARAHLGMAEQRQALAKEHAQLDNELIKAQEASIGTKQHANPAVAQIRAIAAWFTFERSLTDASSFWGANSVMLIMTILVNVGLAFLGNEIGNMRAGKLHASHDAPDYAAPRLAGPVDSIRPIPLKAESVPSTAHGASSNTVILHNTNDELSARAAKCIEEVMRNYRKNSPYASQEGNA